MRIRIGGFTIASRQQQQLITAKNCHYQKTQEFESARNTLQLGQKTSLVQIKANFTEEVARLDADKQQAQPGINQRAEQAAIYLEKLSCRQRTIRTSTIEELHAKLSLILNNRIDYKNKLFDLI